jgi:Rab-GTPase-TBC domain
LNTSFGVRERTVSPQGNVHGDDEHEIDLHWEVIERILFIYAKLNPAIGYVQGMNELIAPLYYVPPNCGRIDNRSFHKMNQKRIQHMRKLILSIYSPH